MSCITCIHLFIALYLHKEISNIACMWNHHFSTWNEWGEAIPAGGMQCLLLAAIEAASNNRMEISAGLLCPS